MWLLILQRRLSNSASASSVGLLEVNIQANPTFSTAWITGTVNVYTPVLAMPKCPHRTNDGPDDSLSATITDRYMLAISLTHKGASEHQQAFQAHEFAPSIMKSVGGTLRAFSAGHRVERDRRNPLRVRVTAPPKRLGNQSSGSIHHLHSVDVYDGESPSKVAQISETFSSYDHRLGYLQEQARLDGYSLNDASRKAFSNFCFRYPMMKRARLFLMENGNLRATWKDDNGAHIGLQFQDSQSIQFVIFGSRKLNSPVPRVTGRASMDGVMRQIDALDVRGAVTHAP